MPILKDISDLAKSSLKYVLRKEPNRIPLSGLTLDKKELIIAQKCLENVETENEDCAKILKYENALSQHLQLGRLYSFGSGRAALSAIISALGLSEGDTVLVPGFTCVAVPNAFWFEGILVVFYDIELASFGPSLKDIKSKFNSDIKAIVVQHTFGLIGVDFEAVLSFAKSNNLMVIEDCAHAFDSKFKNQNIGSFGDAAFFSTERSKAISTFRGGLATSTNFVINNKIEKIQKETPFPSKDLKQSILENFIFIYKTQRSNKRWFAQIPSKIKHRGKYLAGNTNEELHHKKPANYMVRLFSAQAKIGLSQVAKLNWAKEKRATIARQWETWANENGYNTPTIIENSSPSILRYPILVNKDQKQDQSWSSSLGAELGLWFISPIHPTEYRVANCPNSEEAVLRCINLPVNFVKLV